MSAADGAGPPWMVLAVVVPLLGAAVAFACPRLAAAAGIATAAGTAASTIGLAWQVLAGEPLRYAVGGWTPPLGIALYADGLAALLLVMTAAIGFAVTAYATAYFARDRGSGEPDAAGAGFWVLWPSLWAALNALFLSADVFNLYVTLELTTLAAVGMVALAGGETAVGAALRYLLAALFGSLLYLLGVALVYAAAGTLDVAALGAAIARPDAAATALALITAGLAVKAALFPLHFWLPAAHASAPAPVSAALSGLVVTACYYVLLRLWFDGFAATTPGAGTVLAACGAMAIVWGSIQALIAPRLKTLVAYSTVAQVGYLFLVFGLAADRTGAWAGAVLFAVSHGCAKAAIFMAAGSILQVAGHDRIAELDGVGRQMPVTFFTMALASVTLMGLPPSGAFTAKWLLLEAALSAGRLWIALVIITGGLLAAGYLFRVLSHGFTTGDVEAGLAVPRRMEWTALALAVAALATGLAASPLLRLLDVGGRAALPGIVS